jgi:hypothetical protein
LYVAAFAAYAGLGLVLNLRYSYHVGDALSRTANASYVLFSRYPHLAAVGFVWNPLPSLVQLPLLALKGLWPTLLVKGTAGVFMSAAFMAGAVVQVYWIMRERRVSAPWVLGITAAFALHPMIVTFGANGMSEAPFLFFTLWAVHRFLRWLRSDALVDLVVGGIAMALGYATRYETIAVAGGAAVLVAVVTFHRHSARTWQERAWHGAVDAVVATFPFMVSLVAWTISSWIITGSALAQFSTSYGNSAQVAANSGTGVHMKLAATVSLVVSSSVDLEPLLPAIVLVALFLALRRRDIDVLASLALFGTSEAFTAATYLSGSAIADLRHYILLIPLSLLAVGTFPARGSGARPRRPPAKARAKARSGASPKVAAPVGGREPGGKAEDRPTGRLRRWRRPALVALAVLFVLPAFPIAWHSMTTGSTDFTDSPLEALIDPSGHPPVGPYDLAQWNEGQRIASYIASLRLPNGSVLVDTWLGFPIVIAAPDMRTYVITSDLDFTRDLNDPAAYGVRYILVPSSTGVGGLDAVNRRYPTLYRDGAGFATLVLGAPPTKPGTTNGWRLYKIDNT